MYRADAPGRVNLIGEHTDYNDGFVLPTATPQRTVVELSPREDDLVRVESEGFTPISYRLGQETRAGDWGDYVRGVTWVLAPPADTSIRGFDASIASRVPPGAGLASSAALEVALLRALRAAFSLDLDDVALALAAHRAESEFVGARVGTMDQLAASLADVGTALLIDTRAVVTERLPIPAGMSLVVVDSGIPHAHAGGGYNRRRDECERAARLLGLPALRDATAHDAERLASIDPVLARRARHVITENERVQRFARSLAANDLAGCGRLLDASHASLRDDFAVSLPEIDALADVLRARPGVFGARLVGGGFGGAVLALASADRAAAAASDAAHAYSAQVGREVRVLLPV